MYTKEKTTRLIYNSLWTFRADRTILEIIYVQKVTRFNFMKMYTAQMLSIV